MRRSSDVNVDRDARAEPLLQVRDLWFRHPSAELPALRGVELDVHRGECVGIVGPSGAGKSTLCQVIKGIIPHSTAGELEGSVEVFGEQITAEPKPVVTARTGLVLQDPEAQIIGMTVLEDLAFGPENYAKDADAILALAEECLDLVGLAEYLNADTYALSGGQKQRLAIASALMLQPELLVLDEPTSELDPLGKDQVFEIVESLCGRGDVTVIIVEHEVDRLVKVADRVVIMQEGSIAADGEPLDVFTGPGLRERTAGERLPAAADLLSCLDERQGLPVAAPTLDLDEALQMISWQLDAGAAR